MNKTELVASVADKTGMTKKDSEKAVNAVVDSIRETVSSKGKVQIIGFGTFDFKQRAARKGKNPQTGAELKIAACAVPVFRAGKTFKEMVNKGCFTK